MFYIRGKYKGIIENEIVFETSDFIGYKGIYIGKNELILENEYLFYVENYQNNFTSKMILFDDIEYYKISSLLLKINNIGIKTLNDIFLEFDISEIENIIKSKDWEKLSSVNNISIETAKKIINEINYKIYNVRSNSKQSQTIDALKKLGYKSNMINKVLNEIDFSKKIDHIINEALYRISKIND